LKKTAGVRVAAIVLAAGAASRMGKLKQLLPYGGQTLVEHAVGQAAQAGFAPVIVVVGAEAQEVRAALASAQVEIVANEEWRLGMGSSLAAGARRLEEMDADWAAVAVLLADQPLVRAEHLREMWELLKGGTAKAVAAQYNGTLGVPALFRREMIGALVSLAPGAGAQRLLRDSGKEIAAFALPEAALDIDTPEDFVALEARRSG